MGQEHENHTRLHDAGIIDKEAMKANPGEFAKVAQLSSDEVDTLISISEKLGGASALHPDTSFF